jgi:hypothetical protein
MLNKEEMLKNTKDFYPCILDGKLYIKHSLCDEGSLFPDVTTSIYDLVRFADHHYGHCPYKGSEDV